MGLDLRRPEISLIAALCLVVTVAYGALYYGFAVLITGPAAGGDFSRGLLAVAYGGAILTGGVAGVAVGRLADRHGVRAIMALGALLGAGGLAAFSAATSGWQVLAVWWAVLGPATAMTFYEPAYVAIQQAFGPVRRAQAIAVLTLAAGFSGPIFTPLTGALVDELGWRDATRVLAVVLAASAPAALLFVRARPEPGAAAPSGGGMLRPAELRALRTRSLALFTAGAILTYGALEAVVIHRIARFEELGLSLGLVTTCAAIGGLLTLPGRFLLPLLARRVSAPAVLAGVVCVLAASTALMITGGGAWQMALSFGLFGLVFGAALPLRAIVMADWVATATFGAVMGVQAAAIAIGRAGVPALTGAMHDVLDGYTAAMALLTLLLATGAALIAASGRGARSALTDTRATVAGRPR